MRAARSAKTGPGVPKDMQEAVKLWRQAAVAENTDAQVEYGIALFNGEGVSRDQTAAARIFRKAALRGSPIAQDRLADIILANGLARRPIRSRRQSGHLISRANGETDLPLDDFVDKLDPENRAAGEKAAETWLDTLKGNQAAVQQIR